MSSGTLQTMSGHVKNHKIIIFAIFEKFLKIEKKYFWKIIFIKIFKNRIVQVVYYWPFSRVISSILKI